MNCECMSKVVQTGAVGGAIAARKARDLSEASKCRLHCIRGDSLAVPSDEEVRNSPSVSASRRHVSAQCVVQVRAHRDRSRAVRSRTAESYCVSPEIQILTPHTDRFTQQC